jgi:hypothetical protein
MNTLWEGGSIAPSFFTSVLDGGEWSASRLCGFTFRERVSRYPLGRRLGEPEEPVWTLWIREKSPASTENQIPVFQSVVSI